MRGWYTPNSGAAKLQGGTDGYTQHTCSLLPPPPDSDEPFLLEIPDLSKHPKFCNVGYVRDWPHARFYCGAPIRTKNGVTIGTVCVMDERVRINGLTDRERLIMSNMADRFMQYLETKEGDRFQRKAQVMEMELSRFIAEGFLPTEGTEIAERRNGKLWSESILETRRLKEQERRRKVGERRQMVQDMEYAKMVTDEQQTDSPARFGCRPVPDDDVSNLQPIDSEQKSQESTPSGLDGTENPINRGALGTVAGVDAPEAKLHDTMNDDGAGQEQPIELYVPIVHPLQPGVIEMVPADQAERRLSLLETISAALPSNNSRLKDEKGTFERLDAIAKSEFGGDKTFPKGLASLTTTGPESEPVSPSGENGPETNQSSSISGTLGSSADNLVSTGASSVQSQGDRKKRSAYEETTSMEPHFRAMFTRAATVIKNTIDCDSLFVDGDLEGFFEPDSAGATPHASDDWGWSQVSSDRKAESTLRSNRPKQHRQKSGILGYATSKGSSMARFDGPNEVTDMGFDMSALNEEHLTFLLKGSTNGKIISFFDEYPGLEEFEDPEELECKAILQKFLPGCRSVIIVPLHDHNHKLASVCFAWTCSDQKTFYGDKEGRFVNGVATSVTDEMARMHILSGK